MKFVNIHLSILLKQQQSGGTNIYLHLAVVTKASNQITYIPGITSSYYDFLPFFVITYPNVILFHSIIKKYLDSYIPDFFFFFYYLVINIFLYLYIFFIRIIFPFIYIYHLFFIFYNYYCMVYLKHLYLYPKIKKKKILKINTSK